jgi:hypothetical protein
MSSLNPPLTQVIYLNRQGYDSDREEANQYLKEGEIYTVLHAEQTDDYTYFLVEYPSVGFNSVMFEPIGWEETYENDFD